MIKSFCGGLSGRLVSVPDVRGMEAVGHVLSPGGSEKCFFVAGAEISSYYNIPTLKSGWLMQTV